MEIIKKLCVIVSIALISSLWGCSNKPAVSGSDSGKIQLQASELKRITFRSKALKKEMKMNVYLPKGYSNKSKYPVLYMIHGYSGNENSWMPEIKLDKKADELIERNKIRPLIIVTPQLENSYGINTSESAKVLGTPPNNSLNEGMYEDYLCNDVVAYIDSNYSTIASRDGRYIGGLSMGGFIAIHAAFRHTDMFSKVGGHSPALWLNEFPNNLDQWLYPDESIRMQRDPIYIAQSKDLKMLKVYLDCGDKDSYKFYEGCDKLHKVLQSKGVDAQSRLNPGEHDGLYWQMNAEKYLLFYAEE